VFELRIGVFFFLRKGGGLLSSKALIIYLIVISPEKSLVSFPPTTVLSESNGAEVEFVKQQKK
jgi:hypothetical protein